MPLAERETRMKPQPFDYAEHQRRRRIQEIALKAARKVDPLIRKAMEEAAEQGRAAAWEMSERNGSGR
jgi:hypothetical protein